MVLSAGIFVALAVSVVSENYQVKPDRMIEASAAARAAEKIGALRGSIPFDKTADSISVKKPPTPLVVPTPSLPAGPTMQPVTSNGDDFGVDDMPTGSIKKEPPKPHLHWQIFDSQGNPVYR